MDNVIFTVYVYINHVDDYHSTKIVKFSITSYDKVVTKLLQCDHNRVNEKLNTTMNTGV